MAVPGPLALELKALFGTAVSEPVSDPPFEILRVGRSALLEVASYLKSVRGFDMLMDLTAVDRLGFPGARGPERFELVYYLMPSPGRPATGLADGIRVRLIVDADGEDPRVDSLAGLFGSADWLEREVWDMFGVRFEGHPNLKRILLYDEFSGHPLRKDYPIKKEQPRVPRFFSPVPPFGRPPRKTGTDR